MAKEQREPGLGYQCKLVQYPTQRPGITSIEVVTWLRDKSLRVGDSVSWDGEQWTVKERSTVYHD